MLYNLCLKIYQFSVPTLLIPFQYFVLLPVFVWTFTSITENLFQHHWRCSSGSRVSMVGRGLLVFSECTSFTVQCCQHNPMEIADGCCSFSQDRDFISLILNPLAFSLICFLSDYAELGLRNLTKGWVRKEWMSGY